jgi:hypothetical protein
MQRRKFIVGLGSLAAGGAAAMGTGAFTSVSANRQVAVQVEEDAAAYLGVDTGLKSSTNDVHATTNGSGELILDFDENNNGGSGVNRDAVTTFDQVFKLLNRNGQPINVWFEHDIEPLTFYRFDPDDNPLGGSDDAKLGLQSGGHMKIGVEVDTRGETTYEDISGTVTIRADAEDTA